MKSKKRVNYPDHTQIAYISEVHGVYGNVKLALTTDSPDYYMDYESFFIEIHDQLQAFQIESIRFHQSQWLTKFQGIDSRDQAQGLQGSRIFLEDSQLRPLEENEVFYHQLIGCDVKTVEGMLIGQIVDILETGANDVYIIKNQKKEILIPATSEVIQCKDMQKRVILIQPLPGLLDDAI